MKNLLILLSLIIISCGNAPTNSAVSETGGTSIEVAMIKGVVVDEQNRPVEGATVEIIGQSSVPDTSNSIKPDSTRSGSDGSFVQEVYARGALSVIVTDTSGNGTFMPCTLSTNDTIIDLDTIVLEKMASLEISLYMGLDSVWGNSYFFVWAKEFGQHFYFDSTSYGNSTYTSTNPDTTYVIEMKIPAGNYNLRLNPSYLSMNSKYQIVDTAIEVGVGEKRSVIMTPRTHSTTLFTKELKRDLTTVAEIHGEIADTIIWTETNIPHGVGILNNRISQLILAYSFGTIDSIPESVSNLDQLEWFRIWGWSNLKTLPLSITRLNKLQCIELLNCDKIRELPEGLQSLPNLKIFEIMGRHGFSTLPEVIYKMDHVPTVTFQFHWLPSPREKEWALKKMFHGNREAYAKWEADLLSKYGTK